MKIEIKHRRTGAVLYAMQIANDDQYPIRTALERAVADGVNLIGANLVSANLACAYLRGANLRGANLSYANLSYADLIDANLSDVNLSDANLFDADLSNADLTDAKYKGVPVVRRLDARILELIESGDGELDMTDWHTCKTTHCRAGWAVTLAGKAGRKLEAKIGTTAAGALIYHRSIGRVPDFHVSDEDALADIIACAHDQGGIR
jgi:hypothetical protein